MELANSTSWSIRCILWKNYVTNEGVAIEGNQFHVVDNWNSVELSFVE